MLRLRLLRGGALAGLLAAASATALAAPGDLHRVTAERANIRAEPSEDATLQHQIERGDEVLEVKREGDWYGVRVLRTGEEGWIHHGLIERSARTTLSTPPQPAVKASGPNDGGGAEERAGDDGQVVFREEGKAFVYGDELQGERTASGKRFDQHEPTAAHPELPLGSEVTVINPDTGKKIEVEITDRGPHSKSHDLDLSEAAARGLGVLPEIRKEGEAEVRIEATEGQVEQAIESPKEVTKVEQQLKEARKEAAQDGTPQPKARLDLEAPQEEAGRR
jgi:rare lipoprotein A (peptidoglycan hydrolase)